MKKWFMSLEDKQKTNVIIVSWAGTILFCLLAIIVSLFSYVFVAGLVISILFTRWKSPKDAHQEPHPYVASVETAEDQEIKKRREEFLQQQLKEAQDELASLPRYPITISEDRRKRKTGYVEPVFSNITAKGKYNEFVVFDTETPGLAPSRDRIIELAAIRFVGGVPTEIFESFINPEKPIPQEASTVNHITDDMVAEAPTISQILPAFEAFVGGSPLIAHNLSFDLKFIYYSGSTLMDSPRKYFDTLTIARKMLKKPKSKYDEEFEMWETDYDSDFDVYDHKLETLAQYYGITFPGKHRAAADAMVTGKLFLNLISDKQ